MNVELPLLLKEMRATTETLNALVEQERDGVKHAAGALSDTVHRVHDMMHGASRSLLVNLASMMAGCRATTAVVTAGIPREGDKFNGR